MVQGKKLEMTQPTPLGLPGKAVANLWIFPLLGKKEAELGTKPLSWCQEPVPG